LDRCQDCGEQLPDYEDGCLCVYRGEPPVEGYANPTTISVDWELRPE
jgi:hypothetical protein